jgi:cyclic pyranopterin phosphate synthase
MKKFSVASESSDTAMIDITEKEKMLRIATAEGEIKLKRGTIIAIKKKKIKKGDVFEAAKLAAINAVKKTSSLIFFAHPISITATDVSFEFEADQLTLKSRVTVKSIGKTGVELEAIMGVMLSLLTIFDMCKYLEKDEKGQYELVKISNIQVLTKSKQKWT